MKSRFSLLLFFFQLLAVWGCRIQNNPPELTGLTPGMAFVGDEISLTGYQFGPDPVVTVGNGTTAVVATIKTKDDNSIRALVPLVAPGQTQIRVRNDEGLSDPLPLNVRQPSPTLTSITPGNGLPGTAVVLTGSYLNQLRRVRFNDAVAAVQDSSDRSLTVLVPANLPHGPLRIVVETAGGILSGGFIVAGTPTISRITPRVTRPGAEIVIQGTNLTDGLVRINDQAMDRSRTTVKDTEIRTIIPPFAKSGPITVTVFETLIATSSDSVQIIQPPFITHLGAQDGVAGEKLSILGNNLRDVSTVSIGSTPVQFRILSESQLEAIVPALSPSGLVQVSVSGVGGTHTYTEPFFFFQIPTALTVSPARQLRNKPITISGQNLHRITEVRINGQIAPINDRIEGSQVLVNVPADASTGPVTIVNRAGSVTSARPLIVVQNPVITNIVAVTARPGDRVVLQGAFLLNAQVFFSGVATPAVDGKNEDNERWVLIPSGAQSGPLRIVNAAGETTTELFTVEI